MAEVTNRTLKQLLLCCADEADWKDYLPHIEMLYNSSPSSRSNVSPYYVMYGREMKFPADLDLDSVSLPAVESVALDFEGIWAIVRDRLKAV